MLKPDGQTHNLIQFLSLCRPLQGKSLSCYKEEGDNSFVQVFWVQITKVLFVCRSTFHGFFQYPKGLKMHIGMLGEFGFLRF